MHDLAAERFRLIKEFEREGRTDGMPAKELADRKRNLVNELNNFIAMKKQYGAQSENREQLFDGAAGVAAEPDRGQDGSSRDVHVLSRHFNLGIGAGLNMQELMQHGRKEINEIDTTLNRAEKVLEDTVAIGAQVRCMSGQVALAYCILHTQQGSLPCYLLLNAAS
jgi:novel plant SNARE